MGTSKNHIIAKSGQIPRLTPLASAPLPGQQQTTEALLIVASNRATLMDQLVHATTGYSRNQTIANSINIENFDRMIGQLDLRHVTMRFVPYLVLAQ